VETTRVRFSCHLLEVRKVLAVEILAFLLRREGRCAAAGEAGARMVAHVGSEGARRAGGQRHPGRRCALEQTTQQHRVIHVELGPGYLFLSAGQPAASSLMRHMCVGNDQNHAAAAPLCFQQQ